MPIYEKLGHIQAELKAPKNQYNSFGGYKYRSCEDILEAVKPLLARYECVLTISDEIVSVNDRVYVKATAKLIDYDGTSITETAMAREPGDKKGMDASQVTGAASSYARKYCLNGLLCIDDTRDADTEEHNKVVNAKAPAAKPAPKPANVADTRAHLCTDCGSVIVPAVGPKGAMTQEEVVDNSIKYFGVELCYKCACKRFKNKTNANQ